MQIEEREMAVYEYNMMRIILQEALHNNMFPRERSCFIKSHPNELVDLYVLVFHGLDEDRIDVFGIKGTIFKKDSTALLQTRFTTFQIQMDSFEKRKRDEIEVNQPETTQEFEMEDLII
ncbi:hypothetical protein LOD99_15893 [Oopsacas minuta]|uniref:Uncharacterized protein n=1 Tax=Oopsacas minuta TaxID=111878 RepID=A0AAV7K782_9METZ|nr:hypothetical protein LOD99_15893 [Oopsacas minuta]